MAPLVVPLDAEKRWKTAGSGPRDGQPRRRAAAQRAVESERLSVQLVARRRCRGGRVKRLAALLMMFTLLVSAASSAPKKKPRVVFEPALPLLGTKFHALPD